MSYLFLMMTMMLLASQKIFIKQYGVKTENQNPILYSVISTFFAMLFFIVLSGKGLWSAEWIQLVPYALGFAVAYAFSIVGLNLAIGEGPLSVSTLIFSYSLIIPTLYGILVLKDNIKMVAYIGVVLLLVSLFLVNMKKENVKYSWKWGIWISISAVGSGMCSTIQKMQQIRFDGNHKNEFMVGALVVAFIIQMGIVLFRKEVTRQDLKSCLSFAPFTGLANGATNLAVIILTGMLPSAILFPVISAGDMLLLFFLSVFLYKEKLSRMQIVGYGMGILSIILLNL